MHTTPRSLTQVHSANREMELWFPNGEGLISWEHSTANWVYELPNAPVAFGADEGDHPGHLRGRAGVTNDPLPFRSTY